MLCSCYWCIIFIPCRLICWSSQYCYLCHKFDPVYFLWIPERYQCILLVGWPWSSCWYIEGMKSCLSTALNDEQSYKYPQGISLSCFQLGRELLKHDCVKTGQHWELNMALFVLGKQIFVFNGCCCSWWFAEFLELWLNTVSKNFNPTPWYSSCVPQSIFTEIKRPISCSNGRWFSVEVFSQLCSHNVVLELGHNL